MTKQEWEELYKTLEKIHSEFLLAEPSYKTGKNKKIRSDAERSLRNSLHSAEYHIGKNGEVFDLATNGNGFMYEEFISIKYFGYDMSGLLSKIRDKIKTLSDDQLSN